MTAFPLLIAFIASFASALARRLSNEKDRARTVNSLKAMGYRWSDIKEAMSEYIYDE